MGSWGSRNGKQTREGILRFLDPVPLPHPYGPPGAVNTRPPSGVGPGVGPKALNGQQRGLVSREQREVELDFGGWPV